MKKCRKNVVLAVLVLCCFCGLQVYASEDSAVLERLKKAEALGVKEWVDEEGYLKDSFFRGKSDGELSWLGVDGLVRLWSQEEIDVYVENLKDGIANYAVTNYQKVSQVNPATGGTLYTGIFEVDGALAYCIERSVETPAKGAPTGEPMEVANVNLRKVLYYGYNGPKALGYTYVETALAAGEANGDGDNSLGRNVLSKIVAHEAPPAEFKVWKVETNGGLTQDLAYYTMEEKGYGQVKKFSNLISITEGNQNYSLQGAVYGVYQDAESQIELGRVSTGTDGMTGSISLSAGTYYVKEISPSLGYELSLEVKTMQIAASQTTIVEMGETPRSITPGTFIQKVDAQTGQNLPQGIGTLQDAYFQVDFYEMICAPGSNPEEIGARPLKQWILKTDAAGAIRLQNEYLVSGDEFWTDSDGNAVLPLGTIVIREVKSSNGYRVNSEVFVCPIEAALSTFQTLVISEEPIVMTLVKYAEGADKTLEGAVFEHVSPDGTTRKLTTDADGRLICKGLIRGTHRIREVEAPKGYLLNRNEITFEVDENNNITVTSSVDESVGKVETSILGNGDLFIRVEDKIGYKLPETGCVGASALSMAGVLCCLMAVIKRRKRI